MREREGRKGGRETGELTGHVSTAMRVRRAGVACTRCIIKELDATSRAGDNCRPLPRECEVRINQARLRRLVGSRSIRKPHSDASSWGCAREPSEEVSRRNPGARLSAIVRPDYLKPECSRSDNSRPGGDESV